MSILKKNNGPMSKGPSIQSISGDHWSELKFTDGIMTDAIMKHVMGLCYLGMADAGEAFIKCQDPMYKKYYIKMYN